MANAISDAERTINKQSRNRRYIKRAFFNIQIYITISNLQMFK